MEFRLHLEVLLMILIATNCGSNVILHGSHSDMNVIKVSGPYMDVVGVQSDVNAAWSIDWLPRSCSVAC